VAKTLIDLDEEALAFAAEALGTKTKKDTVNAALREIGARLRRERALEELIKMGQEGAFDEMLQPDWKQKVRKGRAAGGESWSGEQAS
jgi:Arc/MetJ family transcription regulator